MSFTSEQFFSPSFTFSRGNKILQLHNGNELLDYFNFLIYKFL